MRARALAVLLLCSLGTRSPAQTRNPHGPRADQPRRDPNLDGPFGPVYRYLEGGPLHLGRADEDRDPASGFMAPVIRTRDEGFLFSAYRDDRTEEQRNRKNAQGYAVYVSGMSVPLVVKLNASGAVQWERVVKGEGFADYEGGWVIEAGGGYLAMIPSYVHPGRLPVQRYLALDKATGKVLWEVRLRGNGGIQTPVARWARLTDTGALKIQGHLYTEEHNETARQWKGEISPRGKLVADRVGPIQPAAGDGAVDFGALFERTQTFVQNNAAGGSDSQRAGYRYAFRNHVALAHLSKHVGPKLGVMVPIFPTADGGVVGVGVPDPRSDEERLQRRWCPSRPVKPVVFRLDRAGEPEWVKSFERPEFDAYGGGLAIEAADGEYLVMIPSYQRDTWGYVARFLKLSRTGEVRWELGLPVVAATGRSAEPEKIWLSEAGTLRLHGFVYDDDKFQKIQPWDGEIDMAGKLLRDEIDGGDAR